MKFAGILPTALALGLGFLPYLGGSSARPGGLQGGGSPDSDRARLALAALRAGLPHFRDALEGRDVALDLDVLEHGRERSAVSEALGWPLLSRETAWACDERMLDGCTLVGTDALVRLEELRVSEEGAEVFLRIETDGHGGTLPVRSRGWAVRLVRAHGGAWRATEVRPIGQS